VNALPLKMPLARRLASRLAAPALLFGLVAAGPILHALLLVMQHRLPAGHDGFQVFTSQWYFLNEAVHSGEVAQWMPFVTEGTLATFWYGVQASFSQNVLMLFAKLLKHCDLLNLLYWGMCVDELILATGTWLLCRRFFRSPLTAAFVCSCVLGSSLWLDQPYWNFRLYYALPLVLHFGHRFLETGRWRHAFLCINLLAAQTIGNLPYFVPVTSFVLFAYFALYCACNWPAVGPRLRALRWRWTIPVWLLLAALSLGCAYKYLTIGTDQIVNHSPGRTLEQKADLEVYLSWGGQFSWWHWGELLTGITPWLDFSLYAGALTVPLAVLGALVAKRQRLHLVLLALIMALFVHATVVSKILFYVWPMMRYFRHLALVAPLVRVLLCLVAGIGFEWLFLQRSARRARLAAQVLLGGGMLLAGFYLLVLASPAGASACVKALVLDPGFPMPQHAVYPAEVISRLHYSAAAALLAGLVLLLPGFLPQRARALVAPLALCLAILDVYHYKLASLAARSEVMPPEARNLGLPQPMPFLEQRVPDIGYPCPRLSQLRTCCRFEGMQYCTLNNFIFLDEVAHAMTRVDWWLRPFDLFLRMYFGESLTDLSTRTARGYAVRFPFQSLQPANIPALLFPVGIEPARKFAALGLPKIQFFSQAYSVGSETELARLMTDPAYKGDLLFILTAHEPGRAPEAPPWQAQSPLEASDRLTLASEVVRFDSNHLIVSVTNTQPRPVWMFYSDVWHPEWRATVNGNPTRVCRAAMAYKAVLLQPGRNTVHFVFRSKLMTWFMTLFALQSLFWLSATAWLMLQVMRNREPVERPGFALDEEPSRLAGRRRGSRIATSSHAGE